VDNGCLWVLPGSHQPGVLYPDRDHHDPRFDCEVEAYDFPYLDDDAVAVEVSAGSVVLFNGYLLHRSLPNTTRHGLRRALVNHYMSAYMSAQSLLPWFLPPAGITMGRADHRDIVLVAGVDPYAYKGRIDLMRPHVRPDGQGGCLR
jgi:phytanoyl-CoA hydroxylase